MLISLLIAKESQLVNYRVSTMSIFTSWLSFACKQKSNSRKFKDDETGCLSDKYVEQLQNLVKQRWDDIWRVVQNR